MSPSKLTRRGLVGAAALGLGAPGLVTSALAAPSKSTPIERTPSSSGPLDADVETMRDAWRRLTVPVMIGDKGPYLFMLDTGANAAAISRELAADLALPPGAMVELHSVGGFSMRPTVTAPTMSVGDLTRHGVALPVIPKVDLKADGLIGVDWLEGQRLTMDFFSNRLEIGASQASQKDNRATIVPATMREGQLTIVDADLNGRPINAIIDSGSQICVGNAALQSLTGVADRGANYTPTQTFMVAATGENVPGLFTVLPRIRVGGLRMRDTPIVFAPLHVFQVFNLMDAPALLIGMDVLNKFERVTLDYGRSEVTFRLPLTMNTLPLELQPQP